jgi:hypothetical protein
LASFDVDVDTFSQPIRATNRMLRERIPIALDALRGLPLKP